MSENVFYSPIFAVSRFFMIYLIFVMGFSQAFYILFLACERYDIEQMNITKTKPENLCELDYSFLALKKR